MTNPNQKSESAKYWEEHLKSWEASAYHREGQQNANWWDRLSTVFRGDAMYVRMNTALELLTPHIRDLTVLDVGCASGRFAFQMIEAGAQKVYGTDISNDALALAKKHGSELGVQDKVEFSAMDVAQSNSPLPQVDLVTALGVIEYFNADDMSAFLGNLRAKYFLLDFPDHGRKKEFPTWILRQVYIRVNRLPGVYLYSLDEFAKLAAPFGFTNLRVIKRNNFYYVTNLPA
ncbi:MAG: class I SAM-dependent methyltransferase [Anaerolineales bacterium]|jgi:cyclopropane fatty-acyl-phospholipid synthase-like methyltransferase|nr:class I SAM-dependent methyltransferase [Anaerolineales bacterium]